MIGAIAPRQLLRSHLPAYQLYGVQVRSSIPLACPVDTTPGLSDVSLHEAPPAYFAHIVRQHQEESVTKDWFHRMALPDGSDYLRWTGLFEFLVSPDGKRIAYHALEHASQETFQTYLVSQALSFALLKQGIEPLHATVVVIHGQAVAFLGHPGYGKSSLGAACLQAGHAILTDDLLVTSHANQQQATVMAHPGPPRLKLFPKVAVKVLGGNRPGTKMNPGTRKLILQLADGEYCATAVPLKVMYALHPPTGRHSLTRVISRTLSKRQACLKLIANTYNTIIADPARLARQFAWAARLANAVPVKSLSYPRRLAHIHAVVAAIHKDLAR